MTTLVEKSGQSKRVRGSERPLRKFKWPCACDIFGGIWLFAGISLGMGA